MIYDFWKEYESLLSYDQASLLDYRLDNVAIKLNTFFQRLIIKHIPKNTIRFYLAGSCLKADTFRDLDLFFPFDEDRELINDAMNQDYFEYENNSYTYRYKNELYQLVYREKYKGATLKELVDGFDFDSTKIAFECNYDIKKRLFTIDKCDMRLEFVNYINTRVNNLSQMSINPFVSLQRAIYFLKRGDDVPYAKKGQSLILDFSHLFSLPTSHFLQLSVSRFPNKLSQTFSIYHPFLWELRGRGLTLANKKSRIKP
jgi:hypothetical protein